MNDKIYSRSRIRLPKIELKNKENNRNTIKILKIIVILGIAINFAYFSLKGIKPIMEKNCISIAKSVATKVSNIKATEVMAKYEYDDILNIIKDENGNIKMVGTNIFTVNKIISDIPVYMQEEFEREENSTFKIPIGSFFGSKLFSELDIWAIENNITRLELSVICSNTIAKHLYEKNGFKVEGIKKNAMIIDGKYVDEFFMAKIYNS